MMMTMMTMVVVVVMVMVIVMIITQRLQINRNVQTMMSTFETKKSVLIAGK